MDSVVRRVSLTTGTATVLAGQSAGFGANDGVGSTASFGLPAGIWADKNYIYVTDSYFDVIRRISTASGDVITLAGSSTAASGFVDGTGSAARFQAPLGIWGDGTNLYICDSLNFTIRKIVISTGAVTTLAGTARSRGTTDGVGAAARFYGPAGIWGDSAYLYIADGSSIRKVAISSGAVTTLSGSPNVNGHADGTASQARFNFISSMWGDGLNLFVADSGNSVLRKVSLLNGSVTTIAGLPATVGNINGLGSAARLNDPTGIAGNGTTLYVVDRMNVNIRIATPPASQPSSGSGGPTTSTDPSGGSTNPPSGTSAGSGTSGTGSSSSGTSGTGSGSSGSGTSGSGSAGSGTTGSGTTGSGSAGSAGSGSSSGSGSSLTGVNSGGAAGVVASSPAPESADNQLKFELQNRAWASQITTGEGNGIQTGYARIKSSDGTAAPSGMAIFGYRRDGILVSEATVPISQWVESGRIPAQLDAMVNTGLAFANPNRGAVGVNFYFTDASGMTMYSGSFNLPGGGLTSAFVNQSPFAPPDYLGIDLKRARSLTFTASAPVGVTGIRGFTNERSDFLFTTLPVAPIGTANLGPLVFAHYAQGGGWKTELMLVNPSDNNLSGSAYFYTQVLAGPSKQQLVRYNIGPRASVTLQPSADSGLLVGWIRVIPDADTATPSGTSVFSFQANGITVTQTAVAAMPEGPAFQLYVESLGDFKNGARGSVQSGFALSNTSEGTAAINLELFALDGTPTGSRVSMLVPSHDHLAMFLNQLPGFQSGNAPFQGFLRVSGSPVAAVGLRGRYNERGDFLITTTTPTPESSGATVAESVFPYFANGGGYTTQFLLNGAAAQVANGRMIFVSPMGEPLPLPVRASN